MNRRQFVIKPFQRSNFDQAKVDQAWSTLRAAITEIQRENPSQLRFEQLYRFAYNLVLNKRGDLLYNNVKNSIHEHLTSVQEAIARAPNERLLAAVIERWEMHSVQMRSISDILMYLDRNYVSEQQNLYPTYELGILCFRQKIIEGGHIQSRLAAQLLDGVARERAGEAMDGVHVELMRKALDMLVAVGLRTMHIYESVFERQFLAHTREFYHAEAQRMLDSGSCAEYLRQADRRLQEEIERQKAYLHPNTEPKLFACALKELITDNSATLMDMEGSGVVSMLRAGRISELKLLFQLLRRADTEQNIVTNTRGLKTRMSDELVARGTELSDVPDAEWKSLEQVDKVLGLYQAYDAILQQSFDGSAEFRTAIRDAFGRFLNQHSKWATALSQYLDSMMRKETSDSSTAAADNEAKVSAIMLLFRFLETKDVFEECYKRHLQKRLLTNKSKNGELERTVIAKLKTECGYQYTSKFEQMFKDLTLSTTITQEFTKAVMGSISGTGKVTETTELMRRLAGPVGGGMGISFDIKVLTSNAWPSHPEPILLPASVQPYIQAFEAFYKSMHGGRKLSWDPSSGSAEVRCLYSTHTLVVTTYQMAILCLWNSGAAELSYEDINAGLGGTVDEVELKRQLISLASPQCKVLLRTNPTTKLTRDVQASDVFAVNTGFTNPRKRVAVRLISSKSAVSQQRAKEAAQSAEEVNLQRRKVLDAAIVRIMKARKSMDHNQLVAEVSRQVTNFKPSPMDIKRQIEGLIERDYIERDEANPRTYHYVA